MRPEIRDCVFPMIGGGFIYEVVERRRTIITDRGICQCIYPRIRPTTAHACPRALSARMGRLRSETRTCAGRSILVDDSNLPRRLIDTRGPDGRGDDAIIAVVVLVIGRRAHERAVVRRYERTGDGEGDARDVLVSNADSGYSAV